MAIQSIGAEDPGMAKVLKIIPMLESPYREEGKTAARLLKAQLDKRGTGLAGLRSFRFFFKAQDDFERVSALAFEFWDEMGYLPQPKPVKAPEPIVEPQPIDAREWFGTFIEDSSTLVRMIAAGIIQGYLNRTGSGLDYFRPYFSPSQFLLVCRRLRETWREMGIKPKTWRNNPDSNPGESYLWVSGYSYTRKGKTVRVEGYWRMRPGKARFEFKKL